MAPPTLAFNGDAANGHLVLLDQTRLPQDVIEHACRQLEDVVEAIKSLRVRGAPAIGVAAAYGVVIGLQAARDASRKEFDERLDQVASILADSRPTAVNLGWALTRLTQTARAHPQLTPSAAHDRLLQEAATIQDEDRQTCEDIGRHGAALLANHTGVLTHCAQPRRALGRPGTGRAVCRRRSRTNSPGLRR